MSDYREAGFQNRIPFDMYECLRDRGTFENNDELREFCIDFEASCFDTIVGPAIDRLEDFAREEGVR